MDVDTVLLTLDKKVDDFCKIVTSYTIKKVENKFLIHVDNVNFRGSELCNHEDLEFDSISFLNVYLINSMRDQNYKEIKIKLFINSSNKFTFISRPNKKRTISNTQKIIRNIAKYFNIVEPAESKPSPPEEEDNLIIEEMLITERCSRLFNENKLLNDKCSKFMTENEDLKNIIIRIRKVELIHSNCENFMDKQMIKFNCLSEENEELNNSCDLLKSKLLNIMEKYSLLNRELTNSQEVLQKTLIRFNDTTEIVTAQKVKLDNLKGLELENVKTFAKLTSLEAQNIKLNRRIVKYEEELIQFKNISYNLDDIKRKDEEIEKLTMKFNKFKSMFME